MDSIKDLMAQYSAPEAPELAAIRRYVDENYHTSIRASVSGNMIIVTVSSASLANTLRLQSSIIQENCNITQRLVFRIG